MILAFLMTLFLDRQPSWEEMWEAATKQNLTVRVEMKGVKMDDRKEGFTIYLEHKSFKNPIRVDSYAFFGPSNDFAGSLNHVLKDFKEPPPVGTKVVLKGNDGGKVTYISLNLRIVKKE